MAQAGKSPPGFTLRNTLQGHERSRIRIAWSPDGQTLASGSADSTILLWDTEIGEQSGKLKGHSSDVNSVAWSPDGRMLASGSHDQIILLWDVETKEPFRILEWFSDHVNSVAWSPDGRILALGVSATKAILLWDVGSRSLRQRLEGHSGAVFSVVWSPDGRMLASGSQDKTICIWGAKTGRQINVLKGHTGIVTCVSFSFDSRFLASKSTSDNTVRLWNCDNWEMVAVLDEPVSSHYWASGLAFHPKAPVLVTLGEQDKVIRIWDLDVDELLGTSSRNGESIIAASVGDQPTSDDVLGFEPYVNAIADFLTNPSTEAPLTLSIEGEWGSGKSSFMLQLEEALRDRNQLTVKFNPWRHDKEDALWAAFALEFVREISRRLSFKPRWSGHVRLFFRRFSWRNGWLDALRVIAMGSIILCILAAIPLLLYLKGLEWVQELSSKLTMEGSLQDIIKWVIGFGGIGAAVAAIVTLLIKIKGFVGSPLDIDLKKHLRSPDYVGRIAFIENFHKDFTKIVNAYAGQDKVYVFIDDLDRCEVPKAAELMQALNLMISNDPQLIFIIGMDREKVAAGLAVKYENLLPYLSSLQTMPDDSVSPTLDQLRGLEYGYSFIEKFIQLPFLVPRPVELNLQSLLKKISSRPKTDEAKSVLRGLFGKILYFTKLRRASDRGRTIRDSESSYPAEAGPEMSEEERVALLPDQTEDDIVPLTEEQKARRERIRVTVTQDSDSQTVHDIVLVVAPALDNNPRRIKQFINLFRLRTFIASATGLFDLPEDSSLDESLTLEQLGKFVVINLKWPLLLADLETDRNLLSMLQNVAIGVKVDQSAIENDNLKRWFERQDLMQFLRSGCFNEQGQSDTEKEPIWSLAKLNVEKLLQVSPRIV